jgi:hypothetical protein
MRSMNENFTQMGYPEQQQAMMNDLQVSQVGMWALFCSRSDPWKIPVQPPNVFPTFDPNNPAMWDLDGFWMFDTMGI